MTTDHEPFPAKPVAISCATAGRYAPSVSVLPSITLVASMRPNAVWPPELGVFGKPHRLDNDGGVRLAAAMPAVSTGEVSNEHDSLHRLPVIGPGLLVALEMPVQAQPNNVLIKEYIC